MSHYIRTELTMRRVDLRDPANATLLDALENQFDDALQQAGIAGEGDQWMYLAGNVNYGVSSLSEPWDGPSVLGELMERDLAFQACDTDEEHGGTMYRWSPGDGPCATEVHNVGGRAAITEDELLRILDSNRTADEKIQQLRDWFGANPLSPNGPKNATLTKPAGRVPDPGDGR